MKVYAVVYRNYFPHEFFSLWENMDDAKGEAERHGAPWQAIEVEVRPGTVGSHYIAISERSLSGESKES